MKKPASEELGEDCERKRQGGPWNFRDPLQKENVGFSLEVGKSASSSCGPVPQPAVYQEIAASVLGCA